MNRTLADKILDRSDSKFELVIIFNKPVLFTCERLKRKPPIEGVNYYDVRHDDECQGKMAQLKD